MTIFLFSNFFKTTSESIDFIEPHFILKLKANAKYFPFSFSYAERNSGYKFENLFRLGIIIGVTDEISGMFSGCFMVNPDRECIWAAYQQNV